MAPDAFPGLSATCFNVRLDSKPAAKVGNVLLVNAFADLALRLEARKDIEGNVWCSMGWADPKEDGVRCYTPAGQLIGKIHLPETCANLVFGGPLRNRLYMCASTSVYAVYVNVQGAAAP
jgi:hypothetical protein